MFASRLRTAAVAVASTLALSACAGPYGGLGVGYGSGGYYGGYGSYGGYGYDPYGYGGYSSYGYGYDGYPYGRSPAYGYPPYGGWYDNYYYPGTGYYVYGRDGSRQRWTSTQQQYWESRRRDRGGDHQWTRDRDREGDHNSGGWTRQTQRWTGRTATAPQRDDRPTTPESAGRKGFRVHPVTTTEEKKD